MTTDEKLAALLAAVQIDPGNRGLARDPHENAFTATAGQFQAACRSIADHPNPSVAIVTGFWIPSAMPPAFETDGPLGSAFLMTVLHRLRIPATILCERALLPVFRECSVVPQPTHLISCERPGPTADGSFRTMRGIDITDVHRGVHAEYEALRSKFHPVTIGIGDGGNEIGMGSIPAAVIEANIGNAAAIQCVVPVDHLIVAGVSNWGAYALAAGVAAIRGDFSAAPLFDETMEQAGLSAMVEAGPLVDGVLGRRQATVDGLTWEDYIAPLRRMREILES